MSLTSAAVRRPVTTVAAVLALVLVGSVSLSRLPVSEVVDNYIRPQMSEVQRNSPSNPSARTCY